MCRDGKNPRVPDQDVISRLGKVCVLTFISPSARADGFSVSVEVSPPLSRDPKLPTDSQEVLPSPYPLPSFPSPTVYGSNISHFPCTRHCPSCCPSTPPWSSLLDLTPSGTLRPSVVTDCYLLEPPPASFAGPTSYVLPSPYSASIPVVNRWCWKLLPSRCPHSFDRPKPSTHLEPAP